MFCVQISSIEHSRSEQVSLLAYRCRREHGRKRHSSVGRTTLTQKSRDPCYSVNTGKMRPGLIIQVLLTTHKLFNGLWITRKSLMSGHREMFWQKSWRGRIWLDYDSWLLTLLCLKTHKLYSFVNIISYYIFIYGIEALLNDLSKFWRQFDFFNSI